MNRFEGIENDLDQVITIHLVGRIGRQNAEGRQRLTALVVISWFFSSRYWPEAAIQTL